MSLKRQAGEMTLISAELTEDERDVVEEMKLTLRVQTDSDLVRLALDTQCTVSQIEIPAACFRLMRAKVKRPA